MLAKTLGDHQLTNRSLIDHPRDSIRRTLCPVDSQ